MTFSSLKNLRQRAESSHTQKRTTRVTDLARMLYDETIAVHEVPKLFLGGQGEDSESLEDGMEEDEDFFKKSKQISEQKQFR